MLFHDRYQAGDLLAKLIEKVGYDNNTFLFALPRGGIVVAYEIAKQLRLPLDIIVPRKIGAPFQKELAIGAICDSEVILDTNLIEGYEILDEYIDREIEIEKKEAKRRYNLYSPFLEKLDVKGKTVILVDDGIATGATMIASIKALKKRGCKSIRVAVPVAPKTSLEKISELVEETLCLYTPDDFFAIGQFYDSFEPVEDNIIIHLLSEMNNMNKKG